MPIFPAALLLAVATSSVAPVVGPEVASTPIRAFPGFPSDAVNRAFYMAQPAAPLATDGDGFVLAFTAVSDAGRARTIVTRLDSQAHAIPGSGRELPASQPYYDAVMPDIVAAPNGFFVAQTEVALLSTRVVVWHLDRALQPDSVPFSIVAVTQPAFGASGLVPPGLVRVAGNRVSVVSNHVVVDYDLGGALLRERPVTFAADDATFAGGALVTAGVESSPYVQVCWWYCTTTPTHFNVLLTTDGTFPQAARYQSFYSDDRVGVAAAGSTLLYVFDRHFQQAGGFGGYMSFLRFDAPALGQIDLEPRTIGTFGSLPGDLPQRPSVASDGTRFLAVWRTAANGRHAVGAAAIERDGTVTPIDIPNLADETMPYVLAAGPNRFLVSYQSRTGLEVRLAGRFITFGGRRPVVGR